MLPAIIASQQKSMEQGVKAKAGFIEDIDENTIKDFSLPALSHQDSDNQIKVDQLILNNNSSQQDWMD